jgi:hypothetical protein
MPVFECDFRQVDMPVFRTHHSAYKDTSSTLTADNHRDHILARLGVKRSFHRVDPGLYRLGNPSTESVVLVTANYSLSFDALRSALPGVDVYILVLDTFGVNVWCAAGKGTFGTRELIHRVKDTRLAEVVSHRILILPQLGAPGVAAHEVKKATGFRVEYGPIRAADVPEYLKTHQATPEMRTIKFPLRDRAELIPVEVTGTFLPMLVAGLVGGLLGGWELAWAAVCSILAGTVLFPLLLPWLPFREFSLKGFVLGGVVILPFIIQRVQTISDFNLPSFISLLSLVLVFPAVTAFISLNFTGSTPFTSKTGVRMEMNHFIPVMAWSFASGIALIIILRIMSILGAA